MLIVQVVVFITVFHIMLAVLATANNNITPLQPSLLCSDATSQIEGCVLPPEVSDPSTYAADPITGGLRLFSEVVLNSTVRFPEILQSFGLHSIIAWAVSSIIWIIEIIGVLEVLLRWQII